MPKNTVVKKLSFDKDLAQALEVEARRHGVTLTAYISMGMRRLMDKGEGVRPAGISLEHAAPPPPAAPPPDFKIMPSGMDDPRRLMLGHDGAASPDGRLLFSAYYGKQVPAGTFEAFWELVKTNGLPTHWRTYGVPEEHAQRVREILQ